MRIADLIIASDPLVLWPSAAVALLLRAAVLGRLSGARGEGRPLPAALPGFRQAAYLLLTLGAARALGASLSIFQTTPPETVESWSRAAESAILAGRGALVVLPPLLISFALPGEAR